MRILMQSIFQLAWRHSIARLASLNIAKPKAIPLEQSGNRTYQYIRAAILACAPVSTIIMIVATVLGAICNVGQSYVLGGLTELALQGQREQVVIMLAIIISLWGTAPLLQAIHSLALLYSSQNLRIGVTDHLTTRLMHAKPMSLAGNSVGNLVERVELAANSLQSVVGLVAEIVVKLLSVALLTTLVLASVSAPMAIAAGIWMITALLLSSYLAYTGMNIVEDASDAHAKVISDLAEIVTNVPLIRSFVAYRLERHNFGRALRQDLYACRRVRSYWVFVLLIESTYKWLFGIVTLLYIGLQYEQGQLTLPQLITASSLIIALSWHFESVAFHFVDIFDSLGVLRSSLRELSSIPVDIEPNEPSPVLPVPGQIVLSNVCSSYGATPVLHDVSLRIEPGTKVGIVGPSGSGKSTLLAVLRGDLVPDSGTVELHGLPLAKFSVSSLHRVSSEALQSALMFNRSVRENVTYGSAVSSAEEVSHALTMAQAMMLVEGLPQGLDTLVGERGASISTGERQRLSVARALLKKSPLLIFDEATSSVDTISETHILNYLLDKMPERTVVVVTHRVATLSRFDLIVVMEQGQIIDMGTPSELEARNGLFQRLLHREDQYVPELTSMGPKNE
ncbi:ABC transporter ATP-binding protein [Photorhabdus hindustanensis]|uniref:ABC transporter ATP-binding protein n=2 Tax=Photorhabdus hindustanensis TaxID=2918802 RepID=A0A2S8Q3U2_9GAMM|nr:ABC transporter ATP-binding protein [Photorhabdus hindustanensis]